MAEDQLIDPDFCERRGFHGPFGNLEKYNSEPGWQGLGECMLCGSTRHVRTEESRRRQIMQPAPEPRE